MAIADRCSPVAMDREVVLVLALSWYAPMRLWRDFRLYYTYAM